MKVYVKFGASVAEPRSKMEVSLENGATVADLIRHIQETKPAFGRRLDGTLVIANGRNLVPSEKLKEGQEIMFVSALAGG